MIAALRFLSALGEISLGCDDPDRLVTIGSYADRLEALAEGELAGFNLARVRNRAEDLRRALAIPDYKRRSRDSAAWLGRTA